VDLDIAAGEFVAVMGPSGSGKSTAMNILGCLDTPSSGATCSAACTWSGWTATSAPLLRPLPGFVSCGFNLLARTSAMENVELPLLYPRRAGGGAPRGRPRAALEQVGLTGWGTTPRRNCPAASSSAWPSRGPSSPTRGAAGRRAHRQLDTQRSHEIMELLGAPEPGGGIHHPDGDPRGGDGLLRGRVVHFVDGRVDREDHNGQRLHLEHI